MQQNSDHWIRKNFNRLLNIALGLLVIFHVLMRNNTSQLMQITRLAIIVIITTLLVFGVLLSRKHPNRMLAPMFFFSAGLSALLAINWYSLFIYIILVLFFSIGSIVVLIAGAREKNEHNALKAYRHIPLLLIVIASSDYLRTL